MEDERTGSLRVAVEKIALGLVAVLVIYVLSIGPAFRLVYFETDQRTRDSLGSFYTPVIWICDHAGPLGSPFRAYIRLWLPNNRGD